MFNVFSTKSIKPSVSVPYIPVWKKHSHVIVRVFSIYKSKGWSIHITLDCSLLHAHHTWCVYLLLINTVLRLHTTVKCCFGCWTKFLLHICSPLFHKVLFTYCYSFKVCKTILVHVVIFAFLFILNSWPVWAILSLVGF